MQTPDDEVPAQVREALERIGADAHALAARIVEGVKAVAAEFAPPATATRRPYSFSHAGRDYRLSPFGETHRAAFERWVRARALDTLDRLRPAMTPADFAASESALLRDLVAGRYDLEGGVCREAMTTHAGTLELTALLLGVTAGEVAAMAVTDAAPHLLRGLSLALGTPTPKEAAHAETE